MKLQDMLEDVEFWTNEFDESGIEDVGVDKEQFMEILQWMSIVVREYRKNPWSVK